MPSPVAVSIPAITAVPSAFCAPDPAPALIARGTTPRIKHRDVMRMGRKRSRAASTVADSTSFPLSWRALANSTMRIAFFAESPMMVNIAI